jgi:hypothetical protein
LRQRHVARNAKPHFTAPACDDRHKNPGARTVRPHPQIQAAAFAYIPGWVTVTTCRATSLLE